MDKFVIIGLVLFLPLAVLGFIFQGRGVTQPIVDEHGDTVPGSVATLEKVELGGLDQYVLMRGWNESNPVLLWLHGGPGAAQMPLAHRYDRELEKEFVVVHWDQRGAGKSNPADIDLDTINIEQYIEDAHELTRYLQDRFGQEEIYLLGFSWGSFLGLNLIDRYPEDYIAYIGVSQIVDGYRTHDIAYPWLKSRIVAEGNERDLRRLKELGDPPFLDDYDKFVTFSSMVNSYGGNYDISFEELYRVGIRAPEYRLVDFRRWMNGYRRGGRPIWDERDFAELNLIEEIPAVDVPTYFIHGERDYMTPLEPAIDYYEQIEAPAKDFTIFNDTAHTPFLAEPYKFLLELTQIKEETF